jgi:tRNA(adenine34) deaminase
MCAGALVQSRVTRLVFGTMDPKAGAVGSLYNLAEEPRHNHRLQVMSGLLADESRQMLKDFFERLREKKRDK